MFRAICRYNYVPEEVEVYAVHLREDGQTDFLVWTGGGYEWLDSYWFYPKEEE